MLRFCGALPSQLMARSAQSLVSFAEQQFQGQAVEPENSGLKGLIRTLLFLPSPRVARRLRLLGCTHWVRPIRRDSHLHHWFLSWSSGFLIAPGHILRLDAAAIAGRL